MSTIIKPSVFPDGMDAVFPGQVIINVNLQEYQKLAFQFSKRK